MTKAKTFKDWTRQDIANEFGLGVTRDCEVLNNWLDVKGISIEENENATLLPLREKLIKYVDIWNEQELIIKFISYIIGMVDYDTDVYKSFANRKLRAVIDGKEISGEVDLMIAEGEFEPQSPYFCLHEYKKERGADNDPLGQLLIAMIVARALNGDDKPIYGAYVSGRNWFFLTLIGNKYCISNEYVATRDDIFDILKIMKKLKILINKRNTLIL